MNGEETLFTWKAIRLCIAFGFLNAVALVFLKIGADKLQHDMGGNITHSNIVTKKFVVNFLKNPWIITSVLAAIVLKPLLTWALSEASPVIIYPLADFISFTFVLAFSAFFYKHWVTVHAGAAALLMIAGACLFMAGVYILISGVSFWK